MSTLLSCHALSKTFNARTLFHDLSLTLAEGERVGMIGPNGSGKSTLLKIFAGLETPDAGEWYPRRSARILYLPQEDRFDPGATVAGVLEEALRDDYPEDYERDARVQVMLGKFGFEDGDVKAETLSGGRRKRLAAARQLIRKPDLLLLDEPTNHLDIEGVLWLEGLLQAADFAYLVVTHDRYFLENVARRVIELNPAFPGGYYDVDGPYSVFAQKKADFLEGQVSTQKALANKVRREVEWMLRGRKAQRIKQKSRKDEAAEMITDLADLAARNRPNASAPIAFDATGRKTRNLIVAQNVSKRMGSRLLFEDVSLHLAPGSRLGLIGPNGSGKSTLIRVLCKEWEPDAGTVRHADDLRVVVFDQQRETLPKDQPLAQALCLGAEGVEYDGRKIHWISWAKRFLFREDQFTMTVGELSGGEQARILMARMMLKPADVLILDEPTNDLDIPSLDVLEEAIERFPGAVVLVTHDRFMLDRLCDELIGLHGDGRIGRYGNSDHWISARPRGASAETEESTPSVKPRKTPKPKPLRDPARLTGAEWEELQGMEARILEAEEEVERLRQTAQDPAILGDHVELNRRYRALAQAEQRVRALYDRWQELEAKPK